MTHSKAIKAAWIAFLCTVRQFAAWLRMWREAAREAGL